MMRVMAAILVMAAAGGCVEHRVVGGTWQDWKSELPNQVGDGGGRVGEGANRAAHVFDQPTWAIELASFTGEKQVAAAQRFVGDLQRKTNMPDLWAAADDKKTYVYRGWYLDPGNITGKSDVRQTRMIKVDNKPLFKSAKMVRVDERHGEPDRGTGVTRAMNLKRYSGQELYSLQVAVYDELFGGNYRQACEKRVAQLNKEGEPAYYYHGPNQSMITIGLHTHDTAFDRVRVQMEPDKPAVWQDNYSATIRQLQERFPRNIYNEQFDEPENADNPAARGSSMIVRIP